jgi:two-component system sensor histidine kinase DesK
VTITRPRTVGAVTAADCPAPGGGTPDRGGLRPWIGVIFASVWLVYLAYPLSAAWRQDSVPLRVFGIAVVVAFAAAYVGLFVVQRYARDTDMPQVPVTTRRWLFAAMGALAALAVPASGENALAFLVYIGVAAAFMLPTWEAAILVGTLVAVTVVSSRIVPGWTDNDFLAFQIAVSAFAMWGVVKVFESNAALRRMNAEVARLAVAEERLRFSRDLHDILGHSLTVITVKAELAGRLLDVDPARAAVEVADVERLSREALAQVRGAVAGYRDVTLPAEIASARTALEAAGIDAELPSAVDDVPADRRELFGWALREGVTNVVRHSGARRCRVSLTAGAVEVADDGGGADTPGTGTGGVGVGVPVHGGHGLAGLAERAASAGGRLVVGRAPEGGFLLRVQVP